jgi:hypothetical protein
VRLHRPCGERVSCGMADMLDEAKAEFKKRY